MHRLYFHPVMPSTLFHWIHRKFFWKKQGAFTMVELILVMGLFALLLAMTLPLLGNFQQRQQTQVLGSDVVEILRRAQHRSITGEDGQTWGVYVSSGSLTLYAGASYLARDIAQDEVRVIPLPTVVSGLSDIHFSIRGTPSSVGSLSVSRPDVDTETVIVNAAGGIFLQKL